MTQRIVTTAAEVSQEIAMATAVLGVGVSHKQQKHMYRRRGGTRSPNIYCQRRTPGARILQHRRRAARHHTDSPGHHQGLISVAMCVWWTLISVRHPGPGTSRLTAQHQRSLPRKTPAGAAITQLSRNHPAFPQSPSFPTITETGKAG